MKTKILLRDSEFSHIKNPTRYGDFAFPSENSIEWIRDFDDSINIVCFTERHLEEALEDKYKNKKKICWLLEPKCIHDYGYNYIKKGMHKYFNYCLTFDNNLRNFLKGTNCKPIWWTPACSWLHKEDHKIYKKSKLVQMIASRKNWTTGHRLRHIVAEKFGNKIDKYGHAFQSFDYTLDVFKDYMFAVVIENNNGLEYFTDKLTSCFYTGTIPIMWNNGWIDRYFNINGILTWDTFGELNNIINNLNEKLYTDLLDYAKINYELAQQYFCPEDTIYNQFKIEGVI